MASFLLQCAMTVALIKGIPCNQMNICRVVESSLSCTYVVNEFCSAHLVVFLEKNQKLLEQCVGSGSVHVLSIVNRSA